MKQNPKIFSENSVIPQAAAELRECLVAPARPPAAADTLPTFETPLLAGSGGSVRTLTSSSSPLLPQVGHAAL